MKKLIALVAAMVMVAGTVYAGEWDFYGSARVFTKFEDTEISGGTDTDIFTQGLQGNARIGARVKVNDELTGRFEYGASGGNANIRILWGEWDFGGGKFGVGQHYTPLNFFYSNQIVNSDNDLLPYGGVYSGRQAMLRLRFGGFQIAAVEPASDTITVGVADGTSGRDNDGDGDYDSADVAFSGTPLSTNIFFTNEANDDFDTAETNFPTIEAKYTFSMDNFTAQVAGGYNSFELSNGTTTVDIDSYVVAAGASVNFGMAYLKGDLYFGENADLLIFTDYSSGTEPARSVTGTTVNDIENFGFILVAGAKLNDMFAFEAGYGYAEADIDAGTDDEVQSYYVQATVTLAPGVFFVPELGVIDYEEDAQNEITYGAIKWQINF